jgi:hypothetical protein
VRFQDLTSASMKFRFVFWDVLPCKIIVDRRFRGRWSQLNVERTIGTASLGQLEVSVPGVGTVTTAPMKLGSHCIHKCGHIFCEGETYKWG